ncbi:hypothetical protein LX32DRAFT_634041 [Colletotrichum zoysiae]|uniref:Uncharacterized protein n=1 Tax=Colletotrichum zoysiae TaxID=1216348 RepID=A0AAD9HUI3_9PEZI|nr:hypothetical protein LX32DRAFT_634041 [Colletotrichum zoysiae]
MSFGQCTFSFFLLLLLLLLLLPFVLFLFLFCLLQSKMWEERDERKDDLVAEGKTLGSRIPITSPTFFECCCHRDIV